MTTKDIRPALRAFLLADSAVSTAVGAGRIYPMKLTQGQRLASIVYQKISGLGDLTNEGPSGLASMRIQVDSWAATQDLATSLANLVKDRLYGFAGTMGTGGAAVEVQLVDFVTVREDYDPVADLHRVSQDFLIWFEER